MMPTMPQRASTRNSSTRESTEKIRAAVEALPEGGIIAEWQLNRHDRLRVSIEEYHGFPLLNVRKWFEAEDGSIRPGKRGISLAVAHLPQLAESIVKAAAVARAVGLIAAPSDDEAP
jgi:hypothetical protein